MALAREAALLHRVDRADAAREPRDERRQQRGHDERDEEAERASSSIGTEDRSAASAAAPGVAGRRLVRACLPDALNPRRAWASWLAERSACSGCRRRRRPAHWLAPICGSPARARVPPARPCADRRQSPRSCSPPPAALWAAPSRSPHRAGRRPAAGHGRAGARGRRRRAGDESARRPCWRHDRRRPRCEAVALGAQEGAVGRARRAVAAPARRAAARTSVDLAGRRAARRPPRESARQAQARTRSSATEMTTSSPGARGCDAERSPGAHLPRRCRDFGPRLRVDVAATPPCWRRTHSGRQVCRAPMTGHRLRCSHRRRPATS